MISILADENIPYVKQAFASLGEVETLPGRLISRADLFDKEILLVRSITKVNAELLQGTAVKFVATATSGINHIDLKYLTKNNITFAHAAGSNANSVAQYVLAGICYWSLQNNKPLKHLSIGIIGYGNVGTRLEKLCRTVGMTCIINDSPLSEMGQKGLDTIKKALACDIVSLHVPLTVNGKYSTKHLINQTNINCLKPDCLLINAARGEVLDESAVLEYKQKNKNFSIILDVWENEPTINKKMLEQCIIATPHIAGYSFDGKIRGTQMIYQACCQFLNQIPQFSEGDIKLLDNKPYDFNLSKHQDIRFSVLKAYDIFQDSRKLKKILRNTDLFNDEYFDNLRKNYPIRREWINLIQ